MGAVTAAEAAIAPGASRAAGAGATSAGLAPWFDPVAADYLAVRADAERGHWERAIERLNGIAAERALSNDNGQRVVFAAPDAAAGTPYELHVWRSGEVPTRRCEKGAWHDLFNALAWLAFPAAKGRLNRLQAAAIERDGVGPRRGGLRDAATLFDESGAIVLTRNAAIAAALRERRWHELFVASRARFAAEARVLVFGHALLEKLRAPYKSACAHALVIDADAGDVDAALAARLDARTLRAGAFAPLPVLGVPGWWPANEDASFYDDTAVFRAARNIGQQAEDPWTS